MEEKKVEKKKEETILLLLATGRGRRALQPKEKRRTDERRAKRGAKKEKWGKRNMAKRGGTEGSIEGRLFEDEELGQEDGEGEGHGKWHFWRNLNKNEMPIRTMLFLQMFLISIYFIFCFLLATFSANSLRQISLRRFKRDFMFAAGNATDPMPICFQACNREWSGDFEKEFAMNASDFYDFPFHPKVLDYGQFLAYCRLADRQTQCFIERCGDQSADRVFSPSNFLCTFKRQHFLRARSCLEDSEPISFLRCDQKCHPPKEGTENAAKEREREKGAEMGKVYSGDEMDGYERELGRVCAFQHCYSQCQEQIATQICPPGPAALAAELVRTYVQWHSADLLDWHILTGNELRLPQSCAKLAKSMTTAKGPDPVLKAMLVAV
ncbi:hypothetical protein niasHS_012196 [Heterodera schachtii]|uniref:Uncharacterized protein n=1 Tax=Heterodera schachtii TaxID=97005 RepID=A0ABD2IJQ6_HETSC